jgi:hypothetical protein
MVFMNLAKDAGAQFFSLSWGSAEMGRREHAGLGFY